MEFTGERYVPGTVADTEANTGYEHWQRYLSVKSLLSNKCVLDIASGEGYGSYSLSEVASSVIGVDISKEAVEHARKTYQRDNLRYIEGTMTQLPIPDHSVDAVVSFETIEHVDLNSQKDFLKEACRVLVSDGFLCISCPNEPIASTRAFELWGYKNPFHVKEHSIAEFNDLLKQYFASVQLMFQRTEDAIILSDPSCQRLRVLFEEEWNRETTQNIIAICSNHQVDISEMNTIIFDIHENYLRKEKCLSDYIHMNETLNRELEKSAVQAEQLKQEKERALQLSERIEVGVTSLPQQMSKTQEIFQQKLDHIQAELLQQGKEQALQMSENVEKHVALISGQIAKMARNQEAIQQDLAEAFEKTNAKEEMITRCLAELNEAKEQIEHFKVKYDHSVSQYNEAKEQIENFKAKYDHSMSQYNEAKEQIEQFKAKYDHSVSQYNEAKGDLENTGRLLQSKENQIQELQLAYTDLETQLKQANQQILTLTGSMCWRITKPLRLLSDIIKKCNEKNN